MRPEMPELPRIAVTMGDPAGIGPEIVVKALRDSSLRERCRPVVFGDLERLALAAERSQFDVRLREVLAPASANSSPPDIDVIQVGRLSDTLPFGAVSAAAGDAAFSYVRDAVTAALASEVAGICTAPLNKAAMNAAGHRYPGHTELLAELAGVDEVSMLLTVPGLNVIHVTTHVGLLEAIERIEPGLVYRTIVRGHDLLVRTGIRVPKIAVCGINPHAGEQGLFGRGEEAGKIEPAVRLARHEGIDARGPFPADTLFFRARRGEFDLVVAMYHDQGHGPVKVLGLEAGVNVTVGLPFVRTSVDHGTAFDIAGQGVADERSMIEALRSAVQFARTARG
jgi:4-hydroxythreonine-4-phosphate dehydrogenase